MKKLIIFLILIFNIFPRSEELTKGVSLWYQGKEDEALTKYLELEKQGDVEVYYYLAQFYANSNSKYFNLDKQIEYLQKGYEVGESECILVLGEYYEKGIGVKNNNKKAEELYKLAIAKNQKLGYFFLGKLYYRYAQTEVDYREIIDLFDKSEEAEGYYINALIYIENIKSEDKNTTSKKVLEYVGKAAKHFYKPAVMNLAQLYEKAKDYKEAVYWYERALGKELFTGYQRLDAYYKVGYYYKEGLGVEKDYAKAKESFEYVIAEELKLVDEMDKENYSKANYELGLMYQEGLGVEKNEVKAKEYFEKAKVEGGI